MNLTAADVSIWASMSQTFCTNSKQAISQMLFYPVNSKITLSGQCLVNIHPCAGNIRAMSMIYSFKCLFGKMPLQEMLWWDTKSEFLPSKAFRNPFGLSFVVSLTQGVAQVQLRHCQCFPSNPLVSSKVQESQLQASLLQLFTLTNSQKKSPVHVRSFLVACKTQFKYSLYSPLCF